MSRNGQIMTAVIGQVYGRLTVVGYGERDRFNRVSRVCRCECGNVVTVTAGSLRVGDKKSCGCLFRDYQERRKASPKPRKKESATHRAWRCMISRCDPKNRESRPCHAGRGIKVCERWKGSFESFLADMGERPRGKTLDRIDNDGDYEPGNCRWATPKTQANNRRGNVLLTHDGQTLTLTEWAAKVGIKMITLSKRIKVHGWPVGKALTTPTAPYRKSK